jgi:hypothetical protein
MPRWTLCCRECGKEFTYSEMTLTKPSSEPLLTVTGHKRDMPDMGINLKCPNCYKSSIYKRDQLVYRD